MPILGPIYSRSPNGRVLVAGMYALLVFGAIWMVYPFLLLLSGSVKSEVDIRHFDIIPAYLYDDTVLFCKFEQQRYGALDAFTSTTRYHDSEGFPSYSFEFLNPPAPIPSAVLQDWNDFMKESGTWPVWFLRLGHNWIQGSVSELQVEYERCLWRDGLPREETSFPELPEENWTMRSFQTLQGPEAPIYEKFRKNLPLRYFTPTAVEGSFIMSLTPKYGTGNSAAEKLNQAWGAHYKSLYDVKMSRTPPSHPAQRRDWWEFVQKSLSARFIRCSPSLLPDYRNFLKSKYREIAVLNKAYGSHFEEWSKTEFPSQGGAIAAFSDLEGFIETRNSPEGISLDSPEFRWRDFLEKKYGNDIMRLNAAHGARDSSFQEAGMPILEEDWNIMQKHRGTIVREYLARNYRVVVDYFAVQGRAFQNTIIFCLLNVITALIVNPIAAYALSRFQPRWGYKVLFFLMATMAFPGEVTQIPSFLLLRNLGMLNTFAALVIPSAANGYSIFLLKGFFDSLPKEIYESATLDGAGELRIFSTITMPLSTPILAVIALGAFNAAYGAFLFALLICQKKSMWTLMVHIYQLQINYSTPVILASLVLAAIPTLLVFVFCQNIIMRGIVIPVEK